MTSDWLPWRIHTPQGKRLGHVKVKVDRVSDHVKVSIFHLATTECHNCVLLVNEFVVCEFGTAHVRDSLGHSWCERAEWVGRLLRYWSQFVCVRVANDLKRKIFVISLFNICILNVKKSGNLIPSSFGGSGKFLKPFELHK